MTIPSALDVTNLFLYWANRDGDVLTNLKIQKLLYYAQAWHLVNFGRPLFADAIQAWDLGPVVPGVWKALTKFGPRPIAYKDHKGEEQNGFSKKQLDYLQEFYRVYGRFSAHELVNMSHNESPWIEAYQHRGVISTDSMLSFYTKVSRKKKTQ